VTLGEKQRLFARLFGELLVWLYANGYECSIDEVLRTQAQAAANAAAGAGILHSLHLLHLAGDLNIFKDGVFLRTVEEIRPVGEHWKTLDPLCRWGGDFSRPDADHFSLEHEGVK
jgi:hypothetical protein